jgi:glutathione-regulated potassium-efflux system ancillary protein KefF
MAGAILLQNRPSHGGPSNAKGGAPVIVLFSAHPYPDRSRANRALLEAARDLPELEVRSLYDLYPDFAIDVEAEQAALTRARAVVWQHPIYWYSVPSLLKHWFDKVLLRGWAYGDGGRALAGKRCLWAATAGGEPGAYAPDGIHGFPFSAFVPVIEQTARFCGMHWEEPFIVHGAHKVSDAELAETAARFRRRLIALADRVRVEA